MGFKLQKTVYETVDPGLYAATVEQVTEKEGDYGPQLQFTFSLDGSDATLLGWTSAKLSNKAKLWSWVEAILGSVPDELDIDELEGKSVNVLVSVKAKEDGTLVNRIESLSRPKVKPKPQPVAVQAEEQPEDETEPIRF